VNDRAFKIKIETTGVACTCDQHQPLLYKKGRCNITHTSVHYDSDHSYDAISPTSAVKMQRWKDPGLLP
jgi:hypothetical protein